MNLSSQKKKKKTGAGSNKCLWLHLHQAREQKQPSRTDFFPSRYMLAACSSLQKFETGDKLKCLKGSDMSKVAQGDGSSWGEAGALEWSPLWYSTPINFLPRGLLFLIPTMEKDVVGAKVVCNTLAIATPVQLPYAESKPNVVKS